MSDTVIQVENLSKYYSLGVVGTGTLSHDLNRAWAKLRGKPDPTLKIGQEENNNSDGHIWALRDISFEVKQGEVLGIIGRNGAGKSTLLKILSRVTAPTSGECRVKGRIASLLEVGTGFHPELTGRENIFLNGAILGMTKAEIRQKFDEIVAFAEVEKFMDTPVKRYSSGMYVRLAFAVAAHLEPEILIIDEVLAVGDAEFQQKCLGKMGKISQENRTVLFVSHNMAAIQRLCPHSIWLEEGTIRDAGESNAICEKYLTKNKIMGKGIYHFDEIANHAVQFLKMELLDCDKKPTNIFRADEHIRFRITYRINRNISGLSVALNIRDGMGNSLWSVSDLDVFPELFNPRQAGIWQYECVAPQHVLRPGIYQAAIGAGAGGQYYHHPADIPSFEITADGYWRKSHRYFGVGGGPIVVPMDIGRPILIERFKK